MPTLEEIEKRDVQRLRMLHALYDATGGSRASVVDLPRFAAHLNVDYKESRETARYPVGRYLARRVGQDALALTQAGIEEAEDTIRHPECPTPNFTVTVINQTNNGPVGVDVQSGGASAVEQRFCAGLDDVANLIRELETELPSDAVDAKELLAVMSEEIQTNNPKPSRLKALATSLASLVTGVSATANAGLKIAELVEKLRALLG